ncbi:MAG: hypothetical protein ACC613_00885 [Synergistales bacterium]
MFVTLFLFTCSLFLFLLPERRDTWLALIGGGGLVALVGWLDDRSGLAVGTRLLAHFVAVGWALFCLGGFPRLVFGSGQTLHLGLWGVPLVLVGGVWLVNLYNFMDGIDGLAAGEAVFVSAAAGAIGWVKGGESLTLALFALVAVVAGFLVWNWSPAKVFMGDIGSGFLGFVFLVFAITGEKIGSVPSLSWAVLLSVFAVDATLTLFRRIWKRENLSQAHRNHAFQLAVRNGHSHKAVTLSITALNIVILLFALLLDRNFGILCGVFSAYFAATLLWFLSVRKWFFSAGLEKS